MASLDTVNPLAAQEGNKSLANKSAKLGKDVDFNAFLGAAEAFGPAATTAGQMYGDPSSSAVLGAAFSGVTTTRQQTATGGSISAGYVPSFSNGGYLGGDQSLSAMGYGKSGLGGDPSSPVVPGVDGFSQADLMSSLQTNNMQLLEMQAGLQAFMQEANIKSNILSADHRARMAMIEKFTARG